MWSGATGVGHWLIQLAHLSGLRVVTTASPKHTDRLKTLGAEAVFDYRDPHVAQQIRAYTDGKLASAGICEITPEDIDTPVAALGDEGGVLSIINHMPAKQYPKPVKLALSLAYTIFGKVRHRTEILSETYSGRSLYHLSQCRRCRMSTRLRSGTTSSSLAFSEKEGSSPPPFAFLVVLKPWMLV